MYLGNAWFDLRNFGVHTHYIWGALQLYFSKLFSQGPVGPNKSFLDPGGLRGALFSKLFLENLPGHNAHLCTKFHPDLSTLAATIS